MTKKISKDRKVNHPSELAFSNEEFQQTFNVWKFNDLNYSIP